MGEREHTDLVWVTGGGGFAGGHLRRELERRGLTVLSIDRREDRNGSVNLDLSDPQAVAREIEETSPSQIIHLAGQSSGRVSLDQPLETVRNNLSITQGLLEGIRKFDSQRRPRLLSVGSCEEYGFVASEDELPLSEEQPLRPSNPYAVSKAAQTMLCQRGSGRNGTMSR